MNIGKELQEIVIEPIEEPQWIEEPEPQPIPETVPA